ncbi:MAG: glycosyltransferase family 4 protein [Pseudomonadota bacterium]
MKILFVHQNCPGQFKHLAPALAKLGHQVVFIGRPGRPDLPGVTRIEYKTHRQPNSKTHHYLIGTESAVLSGQAVARICFELQKKGFVPDVMIGNPGWGETLFLKDVWPDRPLISLSEFYYSGRGSDVGFDPEFPAGHDAILRTRIRNSQHLLAIEAADFAYSPMNWQKAQFPLAYQRKIRVIHDGIDTTAIGPNPDAQFQLPNGKVLSRSDEILTYVSRNLEPYRGFHSFMRALPKILEARPNAHVLIAGGDDVSYGSKPKDHDTWRDAMFAEIGTLPDRVTFLSRIPYDAYLRVLQISSAHLYLTYPFVLSWSMLEAMASGCCVIGSRTPPVEEVIEHGKNGYLVDFFDTDEISQSVSQVLAKRDQVGDMRAAARDTIVAKYDLTPCLAAQMALIEEARAAFGPV